MESTSERSGGPEAVTVHNYVRAESDYQMRTYAEAFGCFGTLVHVREPYDVHDQVTVRGNRDTLYSWGAFDLTSPLTVTLPDPAGRYQSLMIVSEDHSIRAEHGPATVTLTSEDIGTRFALVVLRTFADPADIAAAHRLQDQVRTEQDDVGSFDIQRWDKDQVEATRGDVMKVAQLVTDTSPCFGIKEELDPIYWLLGTALGWGGLPPSESIYENIVPERNDGTTPHTLTVGDVPIDGFWSVTLYDGEGWMPVNDYDAYSYNDATAQRDDDGRATIHFGGDPSQPNFLPIVPGWNYIVRLYQPRDEIRDGTWTFPKPVPIG